MQVMRKPETLGESLRRQGVSRRGFLKFCTATAAMLSLPAAFAPRIAEALEQVRRPSVIWLSFQECTGCTESLTRSHNPTVEGLIFDYISLDYHHTLQAAAGDAAEHAREQAMLENDGQYFVVVDGSLPLDNNGYSTIAGISNAQMFEETVKGAAAVIAVGSCAAFGGLPVAKPNPTGAVSVQEFLAAKGITKPLINVPGCPPIPVVITGVLAHVLVFGKLPELDALLRPMSFYGQTVHDRCYRRPFYDKGQFADTFDDMGAKKGWCLYKLGCKGPTTYNACATAKWNQGAGFPIEAGHGCIGCSEPNFWDAGGFYKALSVPIGDASKTAAFAAAAGVAVGVTAGVIGMNKRKDAATKHQKVSVDDLVREEENAS
jgi:hydrogenase small subunit